MRVWSWSLLALGKYADIARIIHSSPPFRFPEPPLMQWVERLKTFLDIEPRDIGTIGGGRRKPTGIMDVALIQSLVRQGEVSNLVADYGHLIVDECHHLPASSFELVARRTKARYVLELSATVTRKDGHHHIIFMQCGPVRHRVDARAHALDRGIVHRARHRSTVFQLPVSWVGTDRPSMSAIYTAVASDGSRNDLIFDDVLKALESRRSPVLTERRDHLEYLRNRFSRFMRNLVVPRGGMSSAERKAAEVALHVASDQERLVLATGRYIDEGFDDQRLDTLFLTSPYPGKVRLRSMLANSIANMRQRPKSSLSTMWRYCRTIVPRQALTTKAR